MIEAIFARILLSFVFELVKGLAANIAAHGFKEHCRIAWKKAKSKHPRSHHAH